MQTVEIDATEIDVINNAVFPVEHIICSQQLQFIQDIILHLAAVQLEGQVMSLQKSFSFLLDRQIYFSPELTNFC